MKEEKKKRGRKEEETDERRRTEKVAKKAAQKENLQVGADVEKDAPMMTAPKNASSRRAAHEEGEQKDRSRSRRKGEGHEEEEENHDKRKEKRRRGGDDVDAKEETATAPPSKGRQDDADFLAEWPYDTEYGDHFETPKRAYRDVKPLLKLFADDNGTKIKALSIYDPYYCRGKATEILGDLGFKNFINRKRDFYADVEACKIPPHQVLLTNPPYSGDHKERLLSYILEQQRGASPVPFLLLLPAHTAGRALWRQFLWCLWRLREGEQTVTLAEGKAALKSGARRSSSGIDTALLEENAGVCYVCPREQYEFIAAGAAKDKAPFFGIWFCGGLDPPSAPTSGRSEAAGEGGGVARVEAAVTAAQAKRAAKKQQRQAGGTDEEEEEDADAGGEEQPAAARVLRSLAALRAARLVKSEAEEAERQRADPKQAKLREAGLKQLDLARKADPGARKRKLAKQQHARTLAAMSDANVGTHRYAAVGEALPEELMAKVRANKKACHHFFGGEKGCTLGTKCRFVHSV